MWSSPSNVFVVAAALASTPRTRPGAALEDAKKTVAAGGSIPEVAVPGRERRIAGGFPGRARGLSATGAAVVKRIARATDGLSEGDGLDLRPFDDPHHASLADSHRKPAPAEGPRSPCHSTWPEGSDRRPYVPSPRDVTA
jgi:hypothetical protein